MKFSTAASIFLESTGRQAKRARFTAECQSGDLGDGGRVLGAGEIGELLRREGLHSSHLTYWRSALPAMWAPREY